MVAPGANDLGRGMTWEWSRQRVAVTGGASFIGSHLVDALVERGVAALRVVDDLSTGRRENLEPHLRAGTVELVHRDLVDDGVAREAMRNVDIVFHLAAIHGGRGYIDTHRAACASNVVLDGIVIREAHRAGVRKLIYASSGCVYPVGLQGDVAAPVALTEAMVGPPYDPDGTYGWAKLTGELALEAYYRDHRLPSVACRIFTAYGERCLESHAIVAMIARAVLRLDPFEVWGDGTQIRNWTYVGDIVRGLVRAAEVIEDASAVNLGSERGTRVADAVRAVLEACGHRATLTHRLDMPIGPLARVANSDRARDLLGWTPQISFEDGLRRTIAWYAATHDDRVALARDLDRKLLER